MKVLVDFFGYPRAKFPGASGNIQLTEGARIRDLFMSLLGLSGENFKKYIWDPNEQDTKDTVAVNVNDVPIPLIKGLDTVLKEGDRIDLLPIFAGGG